MDMLVAVCTGPVPDGHPRRRLLTFLFESQRRHDPLGNVGPFLVSDEAFFLGNRQGYVPDMPPGRVRSMRISRRVDCRTKARYLFGGEWTSFFDTYGQPGDDHPLVGVFVRLPRPEEVPDELSARRSPGDP